MVVFEIKGQPMGKQRPKFTKVGKFAKIYTPKETVNYETLVKLSYQQQCKEYFDNQPLRVRIKAFYQIPKSYSFKKKMQCYDDKIKPTTKPDCDNIAKIICDALNTIAYDDDKQIIELTIEKHYGLEPMVLVAITSLGEQNDKAD